MGALALPAHRRTAYKRSRHDQTGGSESADASDFLYQESKAFKSVLGSFAMLAGQEYLRLAGKAGNGPWHAA
jgi:hypothetical protein